MTNTPLQDTLSMHGFPPHLLDQVSEENITGYSDELLSSINWDVAEAIRITMESGKEVDWRVFKIDTPMKVNAVFHNMPPMPLSIAASLQNDHTFDALNMGIPFNIAMFVSSPEQIPQLQSFDFWSIGCSISNENQLNAFVKNNELAMNIDNSILCQVSNEHQVHAFIKNHEFAFNLDHNMLLQVSNEMHASMIEMGIPLDDIVLQYTDECQAYSAMQGYSHEEALQYDCAYWDALAA